MCIKTISIIIATYNASGSILECLNSIENEINSDCELIIIDGNSTDNTLDLLNQKKELIDILISEPDKGVYDAWNKGIEKSRGKWIMFLGADDLLLKNSLMNYNKFLKKQSSNDYDFICAQNEYLNLDNKFIKNIGREPKWKLIKYYMPVAHVASLHNRNLFDQIGVFNIKYKICADYELLLRKKNKLKYKFIDYKIAQMKTGGMSFSIKALSEQFFIRKKHLNVITNIFTFLIQMFLFFNFKIKYKIYRIGS